MRIFRLVSFFGLLLFMPLFIKGQETPPDKRQREHLEDILDERLLQKIFDVSVFPQGDPVYRNYRLTPDTQIVYEYEPMGFSHKWNFFLDIEVTVLLNHFGGEMKTVIATYKCNLFKQGFHSWIQVEKIEDVEEGQPVLLFPGF